MSGDNLTFSATRSGTQAVLEVAGELDLSEVGDFRAAVKAASEDAEHLCLDLTGLTFIDSGGLSALLDVNADAQKRGTKLKVVADDGPVRRALELTGLDHLLGREAAVDEPV
jgi:anti-sigma B factor antagonist